MPWRKELEEGIMASSKVVCLIDEAWLTSFNCLQVGGRAPDSPPMLPSATIDARAICGNTPSARRALIATEFSPVSSVT